MATGQKSSIELRPHHLERVLKYETWGELGEQMKKEGKLDAEAERNLNEERTMYETLTRALAEDREATDG